MHSASQDCHIQIPLEVLKYVTVYWFHFLSATEANLVKNCDDAKIRLALVSISHQL